MNQVMGKIFSRGMHVSLAREPHPSTEAILVEGDRDFCIQA